MIEHGYRGTIDQLAAHNMTAFTELPTFEGITLGHTLDTMQPFKFDPFMAMRLGHIDGTIMRIIGTRNSGKTTLAKTISLRYGALSRPDGGRYRTSADDTRHNDGDPEYRMLAEAHGSKEIDVSRQKINFLDPEMGMSESERMETCVMILEHVAGAPLQGLEPLVLQAGLWHLDRMAPKNASPELLAWVVARLDGSALTEYERHVRPPFETNLPPNVITVMRDFGRASTPIIERDFVAACASVFARLLRVLDGDYGRVFGGSTSLSSLLSQRAVVVDYTQLPPSVLVLVQGLMWRWRSSARARGDRRFETHIELHDENYSMWQHPVYARNMSDHIKKSRAHGALVVMAHHRLRDLEAVGSAGSQQRELAVNAIQDTDIWMIGQQSPVEIPRLRELLGFSSEIGQQITKLGQGQFVCVMGDMDPVPFEVRINPSEGSLERVVSLSNQANERLTIKP